MVCTAFEIESITSIYNPSSNYDVDEMVKDPSISFSVNGVSATCSGRYSSQHYYV